MSDLFGKKNRLTTYSIAVAILLVSGILFAFTIQDFVLAGWFGVTLFVAVIIIEIFYFRAHKK